MKTAFAIASALFLSSHAYLLAAEAVAFTVESDTAALWNFQESAGIPYQDEGPAGINLEPTKDGEAVPEWKEGKFGKALFLPGNIRLTPAVNVAPITLQNEVTVEAWINISPGAEQPSMGIIQYSSYQAAGFRLGVEADGALAWLIENGEKEISLRSVRKPTPGEWIHVAATYDGHTMKIFLDGELDAELALEGGIVQPQNNADLMVGYLSSSAKPYFVGGINGVRISNTAHKEFKVK